METLTRKLNIALTDIVAVALVYLIPTLAHYAPFPLYMADPMRLLVLGSLLVTKNWKNSLVLAITLPLFSFIVSAHPVFPKCFLIVGELALNVLLFTWMSRNFTRQVGLSAFASILISKLVYYGAKALFIAGGILAMELVSTEITVQLIVAAAISAIFGFVSYKTK